MIFASALMDDSVGIDATVATAVAVANEAIVLVPVNADDINAVNWAWSDKALLECPA